MKIPRAPHRWRITPKQAVAVQRELASSVVLKPAPVPRVLVGLDCAFTEDEVLAAAVVWDVKTRSVLEQRTLSDPLRFPYVPGLLSFREIPVLLKLLRRLSTDVGGILCDGQGIAHPRRIGLAAHLGVVVGRPTVGCAKSRLCGEYVEPGLSRGEVSVLADEGERIGSVLRTRDGVKPLFVSPGHLVDHPSSIAWVLSAGSGYRMPEPTRLADRLVTRFKRERQTR